MKKSTKNTIKPEFYVDITNAFTLDELNKAFCESKAAAGFQIDNDWISDATITIIIPIKKKPWYKRVWNWITRKK